MMKILKLFVLIFFGLSASSAMATTIFAPEVNAVDGTFEEVDFFYVSIPTGYQLGFFNAADTAFIAPLIVYTGDAVALSPNTPASGPYTATNIVSFSTLAMTNENFILGMFNGSSWIGDSGATPLNLGGTAFSVSFTNEPGTVLSVDLVLSEVPVPAAVWLFGSGLLGLVGVARRRA